jgi:hypothetical protein
LSSSELEEDLEEEEDYSEELEDELEEGEDDTGKLKAHSPDSPCTHL